MGLNPQVENLRIWVHVFVQPCSTGLRDINYLNIIGHFVMGNCYNLVFEDRRYFSMLGQCSGMAPIIQYFPIFRILNILVTYSEIWYFKLVMGTIFSCRKYIDGFLLHPSGGVVFGIFTSKNI